MLVMCKDTHTLPPPPLLLLFAAGASAVNTTRGVAAGVRMGVAPQGTNNKLMGVAHLTCCAVFTKQHLTIENF